jgi:hypothetical protein
MVFDNAITQYPECKKLIRLWFQMGYYNVFVMITLFFDPLVEETLIKKKT